MRWVECPARGLHELWVGDTCGWRVELDRDTAGTVFNVQRRVGKTWQTVATYPWSLGLKHARAECVAASRREAAGVASIVPTPHQVQGDSSP